MDWVFILLVIGTSSFIHMVVLYFADIIYFKHYRGDSRIKRLDFELVEGFNCIIMLVLSIILFVSPNAFSGENGLWQAILAPSFVIGFVFILIYRKEFHHKFIKFVIIHHSLSVVSVVIWTSLVWAGIMKTMAISPYAIMWNTATFVSVVENYWYLHTLLTISKVELVDRFRAKLISVVVQRLWRNITWMLMVIFHYDQVPEILMATVIAFALEIFDVQDQIRSLIVLYGRIKLANQSLDAKSTVSS